MATLHTIQFKYAASEDVRVALRSLAEVARLEEGSDFFFFSELPGQTPFKVDCELVDIGLFTDYVGAFESFLAKLRAQLIRSFGQITE